MDTLVLGGIGVFLLCLGYRFYGSKIERLYGIDPDRKTPALEQYDGVDFVPARHWFVLFGHHFASIAGAAPIIGPVIAVSLWGWGPSIIWIVLGCVFMGGVHDFGALIASVRHKGGSIAEVGGVVIGKRTRVIFSSFIWMTLILIIAVFVFFSAKTYLAEPKVVLPSFGLIPVAMLVGHMLYTMRYNQLATTIIGLSLMIGLVALGNYLPIDLGENALLVWIVVLLIYCTIASVMPVQKLLQPRDYLCGLFLAAGMLFGYGGLILTHPHTDLPFYITWNSESGMLWPMLFVTIACGAISGFHSLVASGTSSKQLPNERYAKKIGYGGMLVEGGVAILALVAVMAGFKEHTSLAQMLGKGGPGPISAFSQGFQVMTAPFFGSFGGIIAVTILNSFILSTLDTATRIGRYITQELFGLKNRYLATVIIVLLSGGLALSGKWQQIWPIFGASNQLVGALALLVISGWLLVQKKPVLYTILPALFVLVTTIGALCFNAWQFIRQKDYLLLIIAIILMVLACCVLGEARGLLKNLRTSRKGEETTELSGDTE
ncbi:MAG: carbon starvation protein A [Deltaproteobacteria bacterium]|nr:carbon starvation protein A [Deltaproteobacteria bacterium]